VVPAMWWKDVYLAGVPGSMSPRWGLQSAPPDS
jgi:hypothetical protein